MITSRHPDWQELAAPLPVDVFDRGESVKLLRQWCRQLSESDAGRVADAVDNLPLALTQAAAYLQETGLSAQAYLELLTHRATAVLAQGVPATYRLSLAASLQLAFDRLAAEEPAALVLLRLAAQFAPEPIPFTLFTGRPDLLPPLVAAGDPVAFAGMVGLVRRCALARVSPDSLQIHRLVQAVLHNSPIGAPNSGNDLGTVARRLLRDAVPAHPWGNPATWPTWRQLLPHVLAVTDPACSADSDRTDIPWLLNSAGIYLQARGEPRPARELLERAHQLNQDMLGEDHPDTFTSANCLASILYVLGEHQRGRELDEDTLTRCRRVLDEDHPNTLNSAQDLAGHLHALGEHQQARELDEDTLTRRRRVLGEDHPDTLSSANNLATGLRALGEHQQAHDLHEDTLTRRRRIQGDDHPSTLTTAGALAIDLHELGKHERARELLEATLSRSRRVLGEDHPSTLRSVYYLALVLHTLGEHERARQLLEDTLSRSRRVLGEDHPDTLRSANELATNLRAVGEYAAARQLDEDTVTRRRQVHGEDHPDTLTSANNLAADLAKLDEH